MRTIIFDIETGPLPEDYLQKICPPFDPDDVALGNRKDPEKIRAHIEDARVNHFANFCKKAALDPIKGQVLCIGINDDEAGCCWSADTEKQLLAMFWGWFRGFELATTQFIGFNIFHFDLPFLIKRSWGHGIQVPLGLRKGRYWSDVFVDLMDIWTMGDRSPEARPSLGEICQHLGLGQKSGNGADFARLWATDRPRAIEYLKNDLQLTSALAERIYF